MNGRPALLIRWEDLPVGVQVAAAFAVSFVVLGFVHWTLLNQPFGRSLWYGLFWGAIATAVIVVGTRTERARRMRSDDR